MKDLAPKAKADALVSAINRGERAIDNIPSLVNQVIEDRAWEYREKGPHTEEKFDSFREFCTTDPPEGLGCEVQRLTNLCEDHPEVQKKIEEHTKADHGGDRRSEDAQTKVDNINHENEGSGRNRSSGTSKSYTLQRLERDAPELYEKVVADEMSANAAAIEAGFRDKTATIPIHKGGEEQHERAAERLAKHFDDVETLIKHLQNHA